VIAVLSQNAVKKKLFFLFVNAKPQGAQFGSYNWKRKGLAGKGLVKPLSVLPKPLFQLIQISIYLHSKTTNAG
jgi:hypothetical protein